jgi:uncharacterized protein (TIGR03032 family)
MTTYNTPQPSPDRKFSILVSAHFPAWLAEMNASLSFSTYQLGKVFFVGLKEGGRLSVFERTFNRCMGLWSDTQTVWLASAFQLWRLENMLEPGSLTDEGFDRLFVPLAAITTGDIDVHDVHLGQEGQLLFVNTLFSCVATTSQKHSFTPLWRPPFVSRLTAEDRCHLNGLACERGQLRYATACSQSDVRHGWRHCRQNGGCVIDIESGEVVVTGLSMPHSPRIHRDRLWLLDSGNGYLGFVDPARGRFEPVVFCPGYARGLSFIDQYAIVGLSKPREQTFSGLPLDAELQKHQVVPRCGLQIIDLRRGAVVHWIQFEGSVEELYDVVILPGVKRPKALGLKTDEIRRNVWFEENGNVCRWSASEQPGPA